MRLSYPFFELRDGHELLVPPLYDGAAVAARGERYALIYLPQGLPVTVNMGLLRASRVRVSRFSPQTGETASLGVFAAEVRTFAPVRAEYGNDAVLILEALEETDTDYYFSIGIVERYGKENNALRVPRG